MSIFGSEQLLSPVYFLRFAASPTPLPPLVWAAPAGASDGSVLRERN